MVAGGIVLIPGAPLGVITEAVQALAGILLPRATLFLLMLCNDRDVLGPWVNPPWLKAFAVRGRAVLLLLSLILMATTLFPNINVTAFALVGAAVLAVGLRGVRAAWSSALRRRERWWRSRARARAGRAEGAVDDATDRRCSSGRRGPWRAAPRCWPWRATWWWRSCC